MKKIALLIILLPGLLKGQIINTVAGTGIAGYSGDGGPATLAKLNNPAEVVADPTGNIYIADYENHVIRKVTSGGIISTIAGNGMPGYSGDGGPATAARLNHPNGIILDASGNIFFCDYGNHSVRKINSAGNISTIAGSGTSGFSGDGGPATLAQLSYPPNIYLDGTGNMFIADAGNHRIRKVNSSGIISTMAGTGIGGYGGDGGPATTAFLNNPYGIVLDIAGNIYIGDQNNERIRKINTLGNISTFAGNGTAGYSGDGGMASAAQLNTPTQLWYKTSTNEVFFADRLNNCVRKINSSGTISTVAGNGTAGFSGDGGLATVATADNVPGVSLDASGNIFIADFNNNRIRLVANCVPTFTHLPGNDSVFAGTDAKFWVATTISSPSFQWQQNAGSGWVSLANAWPYNGVTTDTLTIHSASLFIDTTHYRCIVTNGPPCSDTSASAVLYIRLRTNVSSAIESAIKIFPNPTSDFITIVRPGAGPKGSVQLLSVEGQLIEKAEVDKELLLNVHQLPNGVYILRVNIDGQIIYTRVLKN